MILLSDLTQRGFCIENANANDLQDYVQVIRACLKKYVDVDRESFGEWNDENVVNEFYIKTKRTFFGKLLHHGEVAGFLAYDIKDDRIDGISINLIEKVRNNGIGSLYLTYIIKLADKQSKPIFLKVMKTNPAVYLYTRLGFKHHKDFPGLHQMIYNPVSQ